MEYPNTADFENGNIVMHPFITDLGKHSSIIGDNVLCNKMQLYVFKVDMKTWLEDFYKEHKRAMLSSFFDNHNQYLGARSLFQNACLQLNTKKHGLIDRAVELGLELDFEAMEESFKKTIECAYNKTSGDHVPFFEYINSLDQICQLKILEGRVLYIFKDDIEREIENGSISILSAIQNTVNAIYLVGQSPNAFKGKRPVRNDLNKFEKKLNSYTKIGEKEKESIISDFCNLALTVYENTIMNMIEAGENVEEYSDIISSNLSNLIENNFALIETINNGVNRANCYTQQAVAIDEEDVEAPYVADPDFRDPAVL